VDDHVPFVNAGIPAVDIIDFNYPYWHTLEDTCDKVSPASLERVGRVLEEFLLRRQ
jgi:Zn-dependent M28 family amino/carboxypeptidase